MPSPSTSSSFHYGWTYDVFLNFRGEDTRNGFTGNLYNALRQRGIHSFIDDEGLRRGEEITPALLKAIEESRIAILIFSENYASSTFCLKELVKILQCVNGKGRLVCPVFYGVDPSEVRHQRGSYGDALAGHQNKQKVEEWRLALRKAANLSGWHFKQGWEYEYVFIEKIIEEISKKLKRIPLHIAKYPVGLERRVLELNKLLGVEFDDNKVKMVGIHGIGGIGKTTIACAVYNSIADQFDALCFLADIGEKSTKTGLVSLQETLLLETVGENIKLGGVNHGIPIIKRRLNQKKILLILDDVDNLQQLRALAGGSDWFGSGSKVIITTRDKHLLDVHGVAKLYGVKELNNKEALELFSWNAFNSNEVHPSYVDISNRAICYAKGLPLALEIIGSNLFGKSLEEWESALDNYERIPNKSVQEILRVSYDGLEDQEKEIFLDIGCFFGGERLEYVTNMLLHGRGFRPEYGIGVLIQKSLLMLKYGRVSMHRMIEEMSKEIVRKESPVEPGYRSRLWFYEDIIHVLEEDMGTEKIEVMMLDLPEDEEVYWTGEEFKKMKNLKILKIVNARFSTGPKYLPNNLRVLDWRGYPSPYLPSDFHPRKLSILNLPCSFLMLDKPLKNFKSLSHMNFEGCESLTQLPDISGVPNLTELCLDDCTNLIEVHDSIGFLHKLRKLSAQGCSRLSIFPRNIHLISLETLSLWGCSSLKNFPEILGEMEYLSDVDLGSTAIEELPYSIQNLIGLRRLDLISCRWLSQLPSSIFMLPKLESLEAESCRGCQTSINCESQENMSFIVSSKVKDVHFRACNLSDEFLHIYFTCFPNIETIHLDANDFTILPSCISECRFLTSLYLDDCKQLQEIMALPPNIKIFWARNCISLTSKSTSMLLSQDIHEVRDTHFILPGTKIPDWFDHCNRGASVSFWFRKKFPAIAACFVFGGLDKEPRKFRFKFHVFINGKPSFNSNEGNGFTMLTDHIFLFDIQKEVELPPRQLDQVVFEHEWNHVEIHCLDSPNALASSVEKASVKWSGVHVYQQGNHMDDVQFTSSNLQNRTYDLVDHYPWIKKQCVVTEDMTSDSSAVVSGRTNATTSDKDMQQQSNSVDLQTLKPCASSAERENVKSMIVCNNNVEEETNKNLLEVQPLTKELSSALTAERLDGTNYVEWSLNAQNMIRGRKRWDYISGTKAAPEGKESKEYQAWEDENNMVKSWLLDSMTKDIRSHFIHLSTAKEIWDAVKERYSVNQDASRAYQLHCEVISTRQNGGSVITYFGKLQKLWEEIDAIEDCTMECTKDVEKYTKMVDSQRVYVFLAGLDSHLDGVRGRILATIPLPSLQAAYATVCAEANHQETILGGMSTEGTIPAIKKPAYSKGRVGKCKHCNGNNHVIDNCFKLHGYPDWHPKSKYTSNAKTESSKGNTAPAAGYVAE